MSIPKFHRLNIQHILAYPQLRTEFKSVLVGYHVHLSATLWVFSHAEFRRLRFGIKVK